MAVLRVSALPPSLLFSPLALREGGVAGAEGGLAPLWGGASLLRSASGARRVRVVEGLDLLVAVAPIKWWMVSCRKGSMIGGSWKGHGYAGKLVGPVGVVFGVRADGPLAGRQVLARRDGGSARAE